MLSLVLGVAAGVAASARQGQWGDTIISTFALLFCNPSVLGGADGDTRVFRLARMATGIWLLHHRRGLHRTGSCARRGQTPGAASVHIGLFFTAIYMRMTRASMLEVSRLDFVKTDAKGLSRGVIQRRHILRNALLPVITLAGLQAGQIFGGAILTETVFAWPGIGRLMFEAINQRDYNVILGVFYISAAMVLLFNLITDVIYVIVDPRIRLTT